MNNIQKLKNFLEEFNHPRQYIDRPMDKLEYYFCIEEGWVVGLRMLWDMCLYLWTVDVNPWDVQSLANAIKVLARNYIKNEEEKNVW